MQFLQNFQDGMRVHFPPIPTLQPRFGKIRVGIRNNNSGGQLFLTLVMKWAVRAVRYLQAEARRSMAGPSKDPYTGITMPKGGQDQGGCWGEIGWQTKRTPSEAGFETDRCGVMCHDTAQCIYYPSNTVYSIQYVYIAELEIYLHRRSFQIDGRGLTHLEQNKEEINTTLIFTNGFYLHEEWDEIIFQRNSIWQLSNCHFSYVNHMRQGNCRCCSLSTFITRTIRNWYG